MADEILIGTYTEALGHVDGHADGILALDGAASRTVAAVRNPSWLAASGERVFAVSEVADGEVIALRRTSTGGLFETDRVSSGGAEPAHLLAHPGGDLLVVCNYTGGTVGWIGVAGGALNLRAVTAHADLVPSGDASQRQRSAHPHQAICDPCTGAVLVSDLGADAIVRYELVDGMPRQDRDGLIRLPRGRGPRHMALSPDGGSLAIVNELSSSLTLCARRGRGFDPVEEVSLLPSGWQARSQAAAIVWHPNGRVLWVSLRGPDAVAVVRLSDAGAVVAEHVPSGGEEPRELALVDGALAVANQNGDSILFFDYDDGGRLSERRRLVVPTPVCILAPARVG